MDCRIVREELKLWKLRNKVMLRVVYGRFDKDFIAVLHQNENLTKNLQKAVVYQKTARMSWNCRYKKLVEAIF